MTLFAENIVPLRQALASGRVTEGITGKGLGGFSATLGFAHAGGAGRFAAALTVKPGGYFALHLSPGPNMPDLAGAAEVTLTVRIEWPEREPVELSRVVDGGELALVDRTMTIAGQAVTVRAVQGAPFDFAATVPPNPVALAGIVLRSHDPAEPVADVAVRVEDEDAATTDATGRFFLAALPVAETVTLTFLEGEAETQIDFRPDYVRPVNTLTLSLAS